MIVHHLNFIVPDLGRWEIEEPTGFRGVDFGIKQDDDRLGRDVSYAGSSNKLTLNRMPEHLLDKILYCKDKMGFESIVKYEVDFSDTVEVLGQIDFQNAITDQNNYFTFTLLEIGELSILKRRLDTKVNLLSYVDVDKNPIDPCIFKNVILPAFPTVGVSTWSNPTVGRQMLFDNPAANADYFNPIKRTDRFDIKDSLSWFEDANDEDNGAFANFILIDAKNALNDVKIDITLNGVYDYLPQFNNTLPDKAGQILLRIYYGAEATPGQYTQIIAWNSTAFTGTTNQSQNLPQNLSFTIPSIPNTHKLWISFVSATVNGAVNRVTFNECSINITASQTSYTTIAPCIRLIDAIKYIVKSISGLNVVAPRWEFGGEYHDQFITTSNYMRHLTDSDYVLSLKDIINDYFPEPFADFQLRKNGDVFIGVYRDYYTNIEIGNFTIGESRRNGQLVGFEQSFNQKYCLNRFTIGYEKYQSLKENTLDNTNFEVHGYSEWYIPNKNVNNSKEVKIGIVRSPYSIEEARRRAIDLTNTTATQDDRTTYALDCILSNTVQEYTNTSFLMHSANGSALTLTNDGSFSWAIMGLATGNIFTIDLLGGVFVTPGVGNYIIISVTAKDLRLTQIDGIPPVSSEGKNTTYTYRIYPNIAGYIARTNEGFSVIENISSAPNAFPNPESTINLKFTNKRVFRNYFNYVATAAMYHPELLVSKTDYKNNPFLNTKLIGESNDGVVEGRDFNTVGFTKLVTANIYTMPLLMNLKDYLKLEDDLRLNNGFIRVLDGNGLPIKGYIKSGVFKIKSDGQDLEDYSGVLEAVIEEKFTPDDMIIRDMGNGTILINDEILPSSFSFTIDGFGKLNIFDANGKRLHVPVYYDKVRLNDNSYASSVNELQMWLQQIKSQDE